MPARLLPLALILVAAGFVWSALAPGPLPGDVPLARAVQRLLGARPAWADWLSDVAKFPAAWWILAFAAALAFVLRGWRAALATGGAFALAHGLDQLLRLLIHAPRPTAGLVAVASPAASSGLPSTFGLVFGALFGLTLLAALGQRTPAAKAVALLSAALLLAGFLARVTLGGHWPSQMLLSLALGAIAGAAMLKSAEGVAGRRPRRARGSSRSG